MKSGHKTKRFSVATIFLLLLIAFQVFIYIFIWLQLLNNPVLRTMDFIHFYGAGRLMREGNFSDIYDVDASLRVQKEVVASEDYDTPLLFNHPPYLTPLLGLIAIDNYILAYIYWCLVRLVVWLICGEIIRRFLLFYKWDSVSAWLGAIGSILFFPIFLSFLGGQDTIFSLFGVLIWMIALLDNSDKEAGLGLALATLTPTVAGMLSIPFLFSRFRAGKWFILGTIVLGIYTIALVGVNGIIKFLALLKLSSEGTYYGFDWASMYNFLGLVLRFFPQMDLRQARSIAWIVVLLIVISLSVLWRRHEPNLPLIGFSLVIVTLGSPHLYVHGLSFIMPAMLACVVILRSKGYSALALLIIPVISSVFLIVDIVLPIWTDFTVYFLMFGLLIGFTILLNRNLYSS